MIEQVLPVPRIVWLVRHREYVVLMIGVIAGLPLSYIYVNHLTTHVSVLLWDILSIFWIEAAPTLILATFGGWWLLRDNTLEWTLARTVAARVGDDIVIQSTSQDSRYLGIHYFTTDNQLQSRIYPIEIFPQGIVVGKPVEQGVSCSRYWGLERKPRRIKSLIIGCFIVLATVSAPLLTWWVSTIDTTSVMEHISLTCIFAGLITLCGAGIAYRVQSCYEARFLIDWISEHTTWRILDMVRADDGVVLTCIDEHCQKITGRATLSQHYITWEKEVQLWPYTH